MGTIGARKRRTRNVVRTGRGREAKRVRKELEKMDHLRDDDEEEEEVEDGANGDFEEYRS